MMLLLFLDDIKSERELMRIIPERLDYLWFLWRSHIPSSSCWVIRIEAGEPAQGFMAKSASFTIL